MDSHWIFGYGSLVWRPNFDYRSRKLGFIQGYKRRFWQGDDFHRGDKDKPGRVVTLVEDQEAHTWGFAFEVVDHQMEESLQYLNQREVIQGGYMREMVEFFPEGNNQEPLMTIVYIATSDNPLYLGPASNQEIATQVATCSGNAGHNIEYLVRLAEFMRLHCPDVEDEHLFSIEAALSSIVQKSNKK
ncbi:glutathione-specific gamma-glutamylcyclotransferase 1-like [Gouania willdenowi]|uniref:Gamma-glutamylcyclotransferase n=1 Tax=Gouania willdenowi TaxID=441366 RepID=A0A8C5DLV4_GOUWI|nr:glutathione-specific gamma-glutamylcyclotransferase 1-like [Gouania willdenowi]